MKKLMNLKSVTTRLLSHVMIVSSLLLAISCSMDPGTEDLRKSESPVKSEAPATASRLGPGISFPISFHRVDLWMNASDIVTGTLTVQITNADGSVVIGSTTVSGNSILKGGIKKNSFYFPPLTLNSGEKYRISVQRSVSHTPSNAIYWRTSSGGTNPYTPGVPSVYPGWSLDFAFVTYSDGYVDQQQNSYNYGFAIASTYARWQEFVPQYIWVIGQ
jgi:hypothetical protein